LFNYFEYSIRNNVRVPNYRSLFHNQSSRQAHFILCYVIYTSTSSYANNYNVKIVLAANVDISQWSWILFVHSICSNAHPIVSRWFQLQLSSTKTHTHPSPNNKHLWKSPLTPLFSLLYLFSISLSSRLCRMLKAHWLSALEWASTKCNASIHLNVSFVQHSSHFLSLSLSLSLSFSLSHTYKHTNTNPTWKVQAYHVGNNTTNLHFEKKKQLSQVRYAISKYTVTAAKQF